jgi:ribosomal-protein-alanine N-acetyltransferase
MTQQPILSTSRLLLRPYNIADAQDVQRLAGDTRIADTTVNVPHPYSDGLAEKWIAFHQPAFDAKVSVIFAITLVSNTELVGTASLINISENDARAEIAYWVGVEHWGHGYCTEAVQRLIQYAQEELQITRIVAKCFARNHASARVMEKAGLQREGYFPKHIRKAEKFEDILFYGCNLKNRDQS